MYTKYSAIGIFFATFLLCQLSAGQAARTVFLVRHAEQASAAPDAALTPIGEKRAQCLAAMLKEAGIKQIYVTDATVTQKTAAPLATALKIIPIIVPARDPNALIRDVLYSTGGNTLVVTQADKLSFILARMNAGTVSAIAENEYDRMFISTIVEGAATQASTLRYCQREPTGVSQPRMPSSNIGKKVKVKKKP